MYKLKVTKNRPGEILCKMNLFFYLVTCDSAAIQIFYYTRVVSYFKTNTCDNELCM